MKKMSVLLVGILLLISACKENLTADLEDGIYADFNTNFGQFVAELNYQDAPLTVANFVSLAEGNNPMAADEFKGRNYFDGLTFHRVAKDFVIQGGDPEGDGKGGPGYEFPNEISASLTHDAKGVLSMANAGPDTNGSQFFITLAPTPQLNGGYSVFGKVVKGQEVVDSIGNMETNNEIPEKEVIMNSVKIIRKGKEAKQFEADKVFSAEMEAFEKRKEEEQRKMEEELKTLGEGYEETTSGLLYKITSEVPSGKKTVRGQSVRVYYKGMLTDGKVFDQRLKEEEQEPIEFDVGIGRVIQGWDEGLLQLREGEKARFIIPPHLGYGPNAIGPIPANSILIFDVELAEVK